MTIADLFYRLKGVILRTPSLDERVGDVSLLARLFLRRTSQGRASFAPEALGWLAARNWPGNVRELRAAVECAAALAVPGAAGVVVGAADLAFAVGDAPSEPTRAVFGTLDEEVAALERRRIVEALARTGHNHTHTARELGLSRVGLLKKMDRMGAALTHTRPFRTPCRVPNICHYGMARPFLPGIGHDACVR